MTIATMKHQSDCETALVLAVLKAMEPRLSTLKHDIAYTLEQLVGDECWQKLSLSKRLRAGIAIGSLVDDGEFPLIPAGKAGNTRLYRITGTSL